MDKIDIYDIRTYTDELEQIRIHTIKILVKNRKILYDNTIELYRFLDECFSMDLEPITSLLCSLKQYMDKSEIICFHNTKIADVTEIKNNGLKFPINGYKERIEKKLKLSKIPIKTIKMITMNVNKVLNDFLNDSLDLKKHSQICFYLNYNHHNDYKKFYENFGGEILEQAVDLSSIDGNTKNKILKLGTPIIVKFSVPFKIIESYKQNEILLKILEYWTEKYILDLNRLNDVCEGRICYEVSKEKVIEIIDVT